MKNYRVMTDEQLIRELRSGESEITDFIMDKYKNLVRMKAKEIYLIGGENDDLIQEGMIGLFKAVETFDETKKVSFASFATLCITRQMYTAVKASQRKKHLPLNSYVSLYEQSKDDKGMAGLSLMDTLEPMEPKTPESVILDQEFMDFMGKELEEQLSALESRVLFLHLKGIDYRTIAKLIDKSPKTVDNTLQRIKAKVQKILEQEN